MVGLAASPSCRFLERLAMSCRVMSCCHTRAEHQAESEREETESSGSAAARVLAALTGSTKQSRRPAKIWLGAAHVQAGKSVSRLAVPGVPRLNKIKRASVLPAQR